jgi:thiol-disulfide isomerase/thioredoxin
MASSNRPGGSRSGSGNRSGSGSRSGSGNRSGTGNRSGSGNRSGTGNRAGSGNRKPTAGSSRLAEESPTPSAAERARDRAQQGHVPRAARTAPGGRGRPPAGRRPPQRGGRSSAATAGIFGGSFVVLAAVIIILISVLGNGTAKGGAAHDPYIKPFPATSSIVSAIEHVPNAELAAAGEAPGVVSAVGAKGSGSNIVPIDSPISSGGKPLLVYVGAEYCPYCAATRWALAIALMRFGTLTGLQETASSPLDAYANTHTLSFAKARYSSPYLAFSETEELTNHCVASSVVSNPSPPPSYVCENGDYYVLQTPSKAVADLVNKYDSATWFGPLDESNGQSVQGIPFINIGGRYIESGALYDPGLLSGANWAQIVNSFKAPTEGIGQAILATANRYIAMICEATGNKDTSVCSLGFVKAAERALKP